MGRAARWGMAGLALGAWVGPAGACPSARDLAGAGVRVEFADGAVETYRRDDGVVVVDGFRPDGSAFWLELANGFQVLTYVALREDGSAIVASVEAYDYGLPRAELPLPAPGGRWEATVSVAAGNGTVEEAQTYAFGPLAEMDVGDLCTLDVVEVATTYPAAGLVEGRAWFPELGFGALVWTETGGSPREEREIASMRAVE